MRIASPPPQLVLRIFGKERVDGDVVLLNVPWEVIAQPVSPHMLSGKPEAVAEDTAAWRPQIGAFCHGERMGETDDQYGPEETVQRMERGLRRFLNTPPQPHGKNPKAPPPKRKERAASKGRVHKAKSRA
jgi:hypothetical protein